MKWWPLVAAAVIAALWVVLFFLAISINVG
jgi:hypothetical protein